MAEFQKNPIWNKQKIIELHERLGLKQSQIYKWNWDMHKKYGDKAVAGSTFINSADMAGTSQVDVQSDPECFKSARKTEDILDFSGSNNMSNYEKTSEDQN